MFGELENPWVLLMIVGMFIWLFATFLIQRRIGKKVHRYDERYRYQLNKAKARSWNIMLIVMIISIPIVLVVEGGTFSYFFLMTLFFLHGLTMGISALYYHFKET